MSVWVRCDMARACEHTGDGTRTCKGRSIISSVNHHLVAVRQGFSLNQKLVILARSAGQWDLGLLLSLPASVGVMVIDSHAWPFKNVDVGDSNSGLCACKHS